VSGDDDQRCIFGWTTKNLSTNVKQEFIRLILITRQRPHEFFRSPCCLEHYTGVCACSPPTTNNALPYIYVLLTFRLASRLLLLIFEFDALTNTFASMANGNSVEYLKLMGLIVTLTGEIINFGHWTWVSFYSLLSTTECDGSLNFRKIVEINVY
jgi:hypothetical protein